MKNILLTGALFLSASVFAGDVYFFSYFSNKSYGGRRGESAGLHLAYSRDGKKWQALNDDKPLLVPQVSADKLMRDPSVCRGPDGTYHMVWTTSWKNGEIGYSSSKDLIHWTTQRAIPVMKHEPTVRNCWAPEVTYNDEDGLFYIYWASTIPGRHSPIPDMDKKERGLNHRMYLTTTKDWKTFSKARLWFDPGFSVIDAAAIRTPKGDEWLMVVKNENHTPPEKNLRLTRTKHLAEGFPTKVTPSISPSWVEGPSPLVVGKDLYIYFDEYTRHRYGGLVSHDNGLTWKNVSDEISFPRDTRHGTAFRGDEEILKGLLELTEK